MALDEELLNLPSKKGGENELSDYAEEDDAPSLREAKLASLRGQEPAYLEEPTSLREAVLKSKIERAKNEQSSSALKMNPIQKATGGLLKSAWINLIPSFGLTLLYIDFHWFMNLVLGDKVFGKLGSEWIPAEIKKYGGK